MIARILFIVAFGASVTYSILWLAIKSNLFTKEVMKSIGFQAFLLFTSLIVGLLGLTLIADIDKLF